MAALFLLRKGSKPKIQGLEKQVFFLKNFKNILTPLALRIARMAETRVAEVSSACQALFILSSTTQKLFLFPGLDGNSSSSAVMPPGETTREVHGKQKTGAKSAKKSGKKKLLKEDEDSTNAATPSFFKSTSKPYTTKQFLRLWVDAEATVGETDLLEKQKSFQKTKSTEQYGRILPKGMKVSVHRTDRVLSTFSAAQILLSYLHHFAHL